MELHEKIKFIRKQVRMSQKEFADAIECSQTVISDYERGDCTPSYEVLVRINNFIKQHKIKIKLL